MVWMTCYNIDLGGEADPRGWASNWQMSLRETSPH
jgi:hypothetical protein